MTTIGYEYRSKGQETPFETFLRYTNEKAESAAKLSTILQTALANDTSLLDVGTGNGEYLQLALANVPHDVSLTLVEPSQDLAKHLTRRFPLATIVGTDLQAFATSNTFHVIVMSHLFYHIPRATWGEQLTKALSLLRPGGTLIIVLREKDDAYDFKMAFKPLLFDESFKALTINDVLTCLPKNITLEVTKHIVTSTLHIPITTNLEDTVAIMEFYLNKPWNDISQPIQDKILEYIKDKKGIFRQLDCIATITLNDSH